MKKQYRYEFLIDGEVVDRITVESREELKGCIDALKDTEDRYSRNKETKKDKKDGNQDEF